MEQDTSSNVKQAPSALISRRARSSAARATATAAGWSASDASKQKRTYRQGDMPGEAGYRRIGPVRRHVEAEAAHVVVAELVCGVIEVGELEIDAGEEGGGLAVGRGPATARRAAAAAHS